MMARKIISIVVLCLLLAVIVGLSLSGSIPNTGGRSPLEQTAEAASIPVFDHVVWVVLENRNYEEVMGSPEMPYLNQLAAENVLLDQYYAVRHPSLPNYIALVSGDTYGIHNDCTTCFLDQENLADRIEAAGRTWKTYQEDMPSACFVGNQKPYMQKHNPFIYFDGIRLDAERCRRSVVPFSELNADLAAGQLPDFLFIMPNMCHSGHDCSPADVDGWLKQVVEPLRTSPALGERSLIVITYDEARSAKTETCCGLGRQAGGRIVTVLVSPLAQPALRDSTPYSHYSLLKTLLLSWGLPGLGMTDNPATRPITRPWK